MARQRFNHNTFATGIISKRVQGNTDFEKYNNALDECVNFQIQHTGGCFKRGGSYFVSEVRENGLARLIPFVYSTDQSYMCEFSISEKRKDLWDIIHVNGMFVVVGDDGVIATSSDGREWKQSNRITHKDLNAICYSADKNLFVTVGESGTILTSGDGKTWTPVTGVPTDKHLYGICYSADKKLFVAVGDDGTILTSADGTAWTSPFTEEKPSPTTNSLYAICQGNGKFVAVGEDGAIVTSEDGITWTSPFTEEKPSPTTNDLNAICYSADKQLFVAVGLGGTIVTSTNGTAWTKQDSIPDNPNLQAIIYSSGRFMAAGDKGKVLTGGDGKHWAYAEGTPDINDLYAIAYGTDNSIVVAAGEDGIVFYGEDGINSWTRQDSITDNPDLHAITWGNGKFVAVGDGGIVVTSENGETWTRQNLIAGHPDLHAICYGNGKFVAVGDDGNYAYSVDGINWTKPGPIAGHPNLRGIAYGDRDESGTRKRFVAVGEDRTILQSEDGTGGWRAPGDVSGAENKVLHAICFGNGYADNCFLAAGEGGNILANRYEEIWIKDRHPSRDDPDLYGCTIGNGMSLAVGNGGTIVHRNALGWRPGNGGAPQANLRAVCYSDDKELFVAVGEKGTIIYSQSGKKKWNSAHDGSYSLYAICQGNGKFVAVGEDGAILTSGDGKNWTKKDPITGHPDLHAIDYAANKFVAVGDGGIVVTSTNGKTWIRQNLIAGSPDIHAICYGNGKFVAVGDDGNYAYSTNGINWTKPGPIADHPNLRGICHGEWQESGTKQLFVAVADNGTIVTSMDGTAWGDKKTIEGVSNLQGIAHGEWQETSGSPPTTTTKHLFVAVGNGGTIVTSTNGDSDWTLVTGVITTNNLHAITHAGDKFVAVGDMGTILYSADGVTWTSPFTDKTPSPTTNDLHAIAYAGDKFVAVGNGGAIVGSYNDMGHWFIRKFSNDDFLAICYAEGLFVAAGEDGAIATSGNAESWTLEMSLANEAFIRFFTRYGPLKKGDSIFELGTPFTNFKEISDMKYFQQGNILFLLTSSGFYALVRNNSGGADEDPFSLDKHPLEYSFMPLTFMNTADIALKCEDDTVSAVDPSDPKKTSEPDPKYAPLFFPGDAATVDQDRYLVLRYMVEGKEEYYYYKILTVVPPVEGKKFATLTVSIDKTLSTSSTAPTKPDPTVDWQISAFSMDRGLPRALAIYEGRQFLANNKSYPLGIWGSSLIFQDLFNFFPGSNPGDAVQNISSMEQSDEILWMIGQSRLFIGTRGGVYMAGAASYNDEAITPASFRIRAFQSVGASPLQPIAALDTIFFVDASGRNVHQIILTESGAYQAYDLSLLANDLTQSGIIAHTWQQTPIKTYWCAVNDGYLCSLTYLKDNDILAWTKHVISGKNVRVTSLATIHEDRSDYVWMVVQREIKGEIKRYIEYLSPMYDPVGQEEFKQFYVDSGITKQLKYTINRITTSKEDAAPADKSKNAFMGFNMTPLRTVRGFETEYLVCFQRPDGQNDRLFKKTQVFTARNVVAEGFDLFLDTRFAGRNQGKIIPHKKINPLEYPNYVIPEDLKAFFKRSGISGIEWIQGEVISGFFIHCDTSLLEDNSEIVIQNSSLKYATAVPMDGDILNIRLDPAKPGGGYLYKNGDPVGLSNAKYMSKGAEVFQHIPSSDPIALNLGTNCVVELKEALPANVEIKREVYVNKVTGMGEINQKTYLIAWISENRRQLVLYDLEKSPLVHQSNQNLAVIDSSEYSEYDLTAENNGNLYLYFKTVEGLEHLEGQEVIICADGNKDGQNRIIVPESGIIQLPQTSMYCSVGLKMKSLFKLVPFSGGSVLGSSQGTVGSQKNMAIYLYHSLGGRYGAEASETYPIPYQYRKNTKTDHVQSLFTGLIKLPLPNAKNIFDRTIYLEHDEPTSFNVLAITHEISVSDS
jgi:photosystem II stability/assembly factor-like uncharacterized protein